MHQKHKMLIADGLITKISKGLTDDRVRFDSNTSLIWMMDQVCLGWPETNTKVITMIPNKVPKEEVVRTEI